MGFKGNIKDYSLNPNLQELLQFLKKMRKILKTMVKREGESSEFQLMLFLCMFLTEGLDEQPWTWRE
jgi:hypothetical protein